MQRVRNAIKELKNEYFSVYYPFKKDPCKTCLVKAKCKDIEFDCEKARNYHIYYNPFSERDRWLITYLRCLMHVAVVLLIMVMLEPLLF